MEITCPSAEVKIQGNAFTLCLDMNALTLAEKITGKSFLDPDAFKSMNVTEATALFWACAVQKDTKLTLKNIRSFGYKYISEIVDGCRAAWRAASEIPAEESRPTNGLELQEAVPAQ